MNTRAHPVLVPLIFSLFLAGLLALTISPLAEIPIFEAEMETETDDDWLLRNALPGAFPDWENHKPDILYLHFSSARATPASPPPKHH